MGEQGSRKSLGATLSSLRRPSLSLCSQQSPIAQRRRLEDHSSYHGWFAFAFACNQAPFFFASLLALSQPPPPHPSCCCCCCCLFCTYEDCVHVWQWQTSSLIFGNQSINHGWLCAHEINLLLFFFFFYLCCLWRLCLSFFLFSGWILLCWNLEFWVSASSQATRNTYTYCNATTAATTTSACQQQTRQETFRPSGEKAAAAAVVILQEITVAKSLNVAVTTTTTTTITTRGSSCCKASTTQNDLPSRRQIALATLLAGVSFGPLSYYLVDEQPLPCSIYSSATYIGDFLCWRKLKLGFWDFGSQSFVCTERLCLHKHFIAWEDN